MILSMSVHFVIANIEDMSKYIFLICYRSLITMDYVLFMLLMIINIYKQDEVF